MIGERCLGRQGVIVMGLILLCASVPWVLANEGKSLVGAKNIFMTSRQEQYFSHHAWRLGPYSVASNIGADLGCQDWGLVFGGDTWEYPLWVLSRSRSKQSIRMEHVNVTDPSGQLAYPRGDFKPCVLLFDELKKEPLIIRERELFFRFQGNNELSVYVRRDYVPGGVLQSATGRN
jgi:hypothetical protein